MTDLKPTLDQLHHDLGYHRLNLTWAKIEIVLGLFGAAIGQVLLFNGSQWGGDGLTILAGIVLFVLGGYLTLAGHRTHLYQTANERAAYLVAKLQQPIQQQQSQ